jgi:glycosyltransferase involved in cell wall biosynthesis
MTLRTRLLLPHAHRRPGADRVHVLMFNATGLGGVARTVNGLASRLADTHQVEIHSLVRTLDEPVFPVDPRVRMHWLVDNRRDAGHARPRHNPRARTALRALDTELSVLEPPDPALSAYTDRVLRSTLRKLKPGVLITTRPMLHAAATRWAPPGVAIVAQDHLNFVRRMRNPCVTALLDEAVPTVNAFVTLTEQDRIDYQRRYPGAKVVRIANASPFRRAERAPLHRKVAVSAGRLVHEKGFDRLVEAWAPLVEEFPDWQLHIYGEGERRADLERRIDELRMTRNVVLKGYTDQLDRALADAGLYAMASRTEGFPMVLLEAMSHGLPMIAFDCPRGPGELIEDRRNGRLVSDGDIAGYTRALRELLLDDETRHSMGVTSHERAAAYDMDRVVAEWEQLITSLLGQQPTSWPRPR